MQATPITTPHSLSLTFDENEHQSDESHDQPDGSHDQHNTSRLPPESPKKASHNAPATVLLNGHPIDEDIGAIQEDCGKAGSEGGGEREARDREGREEEGEEDSLLSPKDVFSPTPLEMQSLRTLEQMTSGSVRGERHASNPIVYVDEH